MLVEAPNPDFEAQTKHKAIWRGSPLPQVVRMIVQLTMTNSDGQRYWRKGMSEPWRALRSKNDYADLNKLVDKYRQIVENAVADLRKMEAVGRRVSPLTMTIQ